MTHRITDVLIWIALGATVFAPQQTYAQPEAVNPHDLVSDIEMKDTTSMTLPQLEAFLRRGALGGLELADRDAAMRSPAQIIYDTALTFGLSPRFLLALLQREQSLVETQQATQDQLDWAMGYGVCDDCAKDDPGIQKFRGFANQVYFASERIVESYLKDLEKNGKTLSNVGPGLVAVIDGRIIIPANDATAVLYTYTPHLHGNENFVRIWRRWFGLEYPDGSLLQNTQDGGVWLLRYGQKRPITSRAALLSRFGSQPILPAAPSLLQKYKIGQAIHLPNYSLVRTPDGSISLLVDDVLRPIPSPEVFRSIGFNPDEVVEVTHEDLQGYAVGEPLSAASVHPQGELWQNRTTGGVYFVQDGMKHPIFSREILASRFADLVIKPADVTALLALPDAPAVLFPDGTLIKAQTAQDVFVISQGARRPIINEETFLNFGWKWEDVLTTSERAVLLHPLGDSVNQPTL